MTAGVGKSAGGEGQGDLRAEGSVRGDGVHPEPASKLSDEAIPPEDAGLVHLCLGLETPVGLDFQPAEGLRR